tara:strand:+ start:23863 stop:24276 length:414 start_codon:yes stop_codon:yes gene_type:complete
MNLNIGNIKWMLDEIETMTQHEHIHMTGIIKNSNVNYMENDNGIFIKLNQLPIETMQDLYAYVLKVQESRRNFETAIRTISVDETVNVKDDNTNTETDKPDIQIDDWKVKIIEKMRNESKIKQRKKRIQPSVKATTE